jgi:hypothetical protein
MMELRGSDLPPLYFIYAAKYNLLASGSAWESKEYFCREYSLTTSEALIKVS